MIKVGITGGIGAGKTIVCEVFRLLGVPVYNADDRAKYLMTYDQNLIGRIVEVFGSEAYNSDGQLNRALISNVVFKDKEQLDILNGIVHPAVEKDFIRWTENYQHRKYIIKEAALLLESGSYKKLDYVINVVAPEPMRIARVLQRDPHRNQLDVKNIISRQLDDSEKEKISSFVIVNDESSLLLPQALKIHAFFIN
jgi:dephospho-CoA kinase